jgi:hypothetical protein
VVDAIVRSRKAGRARKTSAIIVYPMNALANSQIKEIEKFISQSGLPEDLKPVVRRYTGQESQEERQRIADNPPDILLTNFMMAELLLTRQDSLDTQVINNASGLEFIVLDELHTYRGRQGADVAILVRRLRNRCAPTKAPICIGTSATMANEGSDVGRAKAVADVASRLFGASIGPDAVIDESLQRATDDRLKLDDVRPKLAHSFQRMFDMANDSGHFIDHCRMTPREHSPNVPEHRRPHHSRQGVWGVVGTRASVELRKGKPVTRDPMAFASSTPCARHPMRSLKGGPKGGPNNRCWK